MKADWVEAVDWGQRKYWYDQTQERNLWIDMDDGKYVVTETKRNGLQSGITNIAGPFDTLEAAQAAYLLIGAE